MTNRKLYLLFLIGLSIGLLGMNAPESQIDPSVANELTQAVKENDLVCLSRILHRNDGFSYWNSQGSKVCGFAAVKQNEQMLSYLLKIVDWAKAKIAKIKVKSSLLEQESRNQEVLEFALQELKSKASLSSPKAYFSPGIKEVLKQFINNEKKGIWGAIYQFTLFDVAWCMAEKMKIKDFSIGLVIDREFKKHYCIGLRLLVEKGAIVRKSMQRLPQTKNRKYDPSNIKTGPQFYENMHHKFLIFYQNENEKLLVWTGSFNFTNAANENNWENVIIIDDLASIQKFIQELQLLMCHSKDIPLDELKTKSAF